MGFTTNAQADNAAFDLIGPKFQAHVQRAGVTLPIAAVPNIEPGDRLWIHPDLPDSQSAHYLMVVVFLRGATNPPPESWFTRAETWSKPVHEEGIFVTVPKDAEQAVILLAPETGGAYSTLRAAVRGKPGAFVRASQDLEQLSLDRLRLEAYLDAVRETSITDPDKLKTRTTLLARSLNMKLDQQCFDKPTAQQVPCLTQNTDQLVLDDQHTQNMVATLTSGPSTDLLTQLSATPTARAGYYSPYVGAVVDAVRILSTAHTAQYQYIPALALPKKDDLNLRLNNPPSFRNPKSVLVIALPPVHDTVPPPLRVLEPTQVFCLNKPDLLLPADGAPLAFATELAHNFVLHLEDKAGKPLDLPATPDAARGGFAIETSAMEGKSLDGDVTATLRGSWGFHSFEGPHFHLRSSQPSQWVVASKDASALIVGREDTLHVDSPDACCVSEVLVQNQDGKTTSIPWKAAKPDELELKVPLQSATAGPLKMLVKQFGLKEPGELTLNTYAEAARLDSFTLHAGDLDGVLRGTRLDEVSKVELGGTTFSAGNLSRAGQHDELKLMTQDAAAVSKFKPTDALIAHVALKDGRTLDLSTAIETARPKLILLSKNVQPDSSSVIQLGSPEELPQNGRLSFFLKTQTPENFPSTEKIEIATKDESFHVLLTEGDGSITLQDAKTVYAVFDPMKLLGQSAFGPLKLRPVSAEGVPGDWQPLINLVRIPELKEVRCTLPRREHPETGANSEKTKAPHKSSPDDMPKRTGAQNSLVSQKAQTASSVESAWSNKVIAPGDDGGSEENDMATENNSPQKQCTLSGNKLFLIDTVSADRDFTNSVPVPDGFVASTLNIPAPNGNTLYVKLRDDPGTVDTAVVPLQNEPPTMGSTAH